jgi:hypothetical protein
MDTLNSHFFKFEYLIAKVMKDQGL